MNKKGIGQIGAIILFMMFVINWFIWLGTWLGVVGQSAIITANLTGIEAFFMANLNFVILICMILGMMGWMYFAGE